MSLLHQLCVMSLCQPTDSMMLPKSMLGPLKGPEGEESPGGRVCLEEKL